MSHGAERPAYAAFSGLFAAAVVSREFCNLLLQDPQRALQLGYAKQSFRLSDEERAFLITIYAKSLKGLAEQIILYEPKSTPPTDA